MGGNGTSVVCASPAPGPKARLVCATCSANAEEKKNTCVLGKDKTDSVLQRESKVQGWGNAMDEVTGWEWPLCWRRSVGDGTSTDTLVA